MVIKQELFYEFWERKGKYLKINNANRFKEDLAAKISELGDVGEIDQYVCTLRTKRESTRVIIASFYMYLIDNGYDIESELFTKKFYDYPFERQLEIAKFLHSPRTPREIQEKFDIDERTVRSDLQELEEGITVLGSTIQIEKEKKGRSYYYKTTLHPVFLPLNLTEVYALTVYLDHAINQFDPNAQMISNISQRIKLQLSDYAFNKLFPDEERELTDNHYINDELLAHQREGIIMYLMKSGQKCKFIWNNNEYEGRITWNDGEYKICLENGEILEADIAEVDFLVESLDYK